MDLVNCDNIQWEYTLNWAPIKRREEIKSSSSCGIHIQDIALRIKEYFPSRASEQLASGSTLRTVIILLATHCPYRLSFLNCPPTANAL